ncbi:coiled-coil domain-containing protein 15 [Spea bombifrons]|uniref:coiled-coil domain-containing protein 15 n=1 Tax=Spea bombifrons TaxID=233779 RepID=UPI00234B6EB2|nr:coiled-coil domain-containing protein 15 [Spea bombifrons]
MAAPGRRGTRLVVNQAVLAERNPSDIAPVGAWVECVRGQRDQECGATASARQVEEQLLQHQRAKQEKLHHFQVEVRRRVREHAKLRKKRHIQKSYDAIVREGFVVDQTSDAAVRLTPKRNTCVFRNTPVAICSPRSQYVSAKKISGGIDEDDGGDENNNRPFKQQEKTLGKTMKQARRRLAALKTVESEALSLPGGVWKVSPMRDNPVSRRSPVPRMNEEGNDELVLSGYHDFPVELLVQESGGCLPEQQTSENGMRPTWSRLMKEPYPAGPAPAFSTDYRATFVLRPGVDEEDERKQRQQQYGAYRRLFMDIEREQVKETRRKKEQEKKMAKIKNEKELRRQLEEHRLRDAADREERSSHQRRLERLALEWEIHKENLLRTQKTKERARFVDALRAQMKQKMELHCIRLPALCCCGPTFWDSHPDTCANNCVFYKNPKAYTRALQSLISSQDAWEGGLSARLSTCNLNPAHSSS